MSATLFLTLRAGTIRVVTTAPLHAYRTNAMLIMFSAHLQDSYIPGSSSPELMPCFLKNMNIEIALTPYCTTLKERLRLL
jgi:hypothetical protein